jgi:hypothetical protein
VAVDRAAVELAAVELAAGLETRPPTPTHPAVVTTIIASYERKRVRRTTLIASAL